MRVTDPGIAMAEASGVTLSGGLPTLDAGVERLELCGAD